MRNKLLILVFGILYSAFSVQWVHAADDVVLQSLTWRSTPPIVNILNRLYITLRNTGSQDRTRILQVRGFGPSQTVDILAGQTATVFIDDTPRIQGTVTFTIDLYSEAASVCAVLPSNTLVATYTQDVFVDGDNDGDGIPNSTDPDDDNEGLPDTTEIQIGTDPFNPDTDRDSQRDGVDPCPSDAQNRCVVTPTATNTPGITGSTSTSSTTGTTSNASGNPVIAAIQDILGLSVEAVPTPGLLGQTSGVSNEISPVTVTDSCVQCVVWPVIIGEIIVAGLFILLIHLGFESDQRKWLYLPGLLIPVLAYIIFIIINPCLRPALIFPSTYFWCKWLAFISAGIYGVPVLGITLLQKYKEHIA